MIEPTEAASPPASSSSNPDDVRHALLTEEQHRTEITERIERMAQALERSATSLRRELANPSDPATKAERIQHEIAGLIPNLGTHQLTHAAIAWTVSKEAITRLLTEGIEPA
jgi:hypothetical protein